MIGLIPSLLLDKMNEAKNDAMILFLLLLSIVETTYFYVSTSKYVRYVRTVSYYSLCRNMYCTYAYEAQWEYSS